MPNISFDIFFDQDFVNISAHRGRVPRAKPGWKLRTAPKLPPKEEPVDPAATPRPERRPPINQSRPVKLGRPAGEKDEVADKPSPASDTASQSGERVRRKPPKLGPRKKPAEEAPPSN